MLIRLWQHLTVRRRRQLSAVLLLTLITAFAEIASIGALVPFLAVVAAPETALNNGWVGSAANALGITSAEHLLLPFTLVFSVAALFAGAMRVLLLFATNVLSSAVGSDLSSELYRRTLYQPYQLHISRNTSTVTSSIGKVGGVMSIVAQCLLLLSALVMLVSITAVLIAIDPQLAVMTFLSFGGAYLMISFFFRRRLRDNSMLIAAEQTKLFQMVQEGLSGIRDILLDGTQALHADEYAKTDRPFRRMQGINVFIAGAPRFVVEALGMVIIAALALLVAGSPGGVAAQLPVLGALALGAQRLLPALQQGFAAWAVIVGNRGVLGDILELLEQAVDQSMLGPQPAPMTFQNRIEFKRVGFRYSPGGPAVLNGVDLTIPAGSRIGIVGNTGSGKSTALDILMGLLTPSDGEVLIDGVALSGPQIRAWQRNIAHVPQSIFLYDASIAENIALGVPRDRIDEARLEEAACKAQIADFISQCSDGYDTSVGERGVKLSGGQKQRIGIARALYRQAKVIVLDEATSALDSATERMVLEGIEALGQEVTVIMVAHRVTTLENCSEIVEFSNGHIVRAGTYRELFN